MTVKLTHSFYITFEKTVTLNLLQHGRQVAKINVQKISL